METTFTSSPISFGLNIYKYPTLHFHDVLLLPELKVAEIFINIYHFNIYDVSV